MTTPEHPLPTVYGNRPVPLRLAADEDGLTLYDHERGVEIEIGRAANTIVVENQEGSGWYLTAVLAIDPPEIDGLPLDGITLSGPASLEGLTADEVMQVWTRGGASTSPAERLVAYLQARTGPPDSEG